MERRHAALPGDEEALLRRREARDRVLADAPPRPGGHERAEALSWRGSCAGAPAQCQTIARKILWSGGVPCISARPGSVSADRCVVVMAANIQALRRVHVSHAGAHERASYGVLVVTSRRLPPSGAASSHEPMAEARIHLWPFSLLPLGATLCGHPDSEGALRASLRRPTEKYWLRGAPSSLCIISNRRRNPTSRGRPG